MSELKPLVSPPGIYGIGPWVEIVFRDKKRPAVVINRNISIKKGVMVENYTVRIVTVTKEALEASKLDMEKFFKSETENRK